MVIVPVCQGLGYKHISAKPENIITVQNYMCSRDNDSENVGVPIGIYDSIKDKLGISRLDFFIDSNEKIYMQENGQDNLIEFSNIDEARKIC